MRREKREERREKRKEKEKREKRFDPVVEIFIIFQGIFFYLEY